MAKKYSKSRKAHRKGSRKASRKTHRKSSTYRKRRMYGGESSPAPVGGNPMGEMQAQSLAQGRQFEAYHANQHGGAALDGGPFPGVVVQPSLIPGNMMNAARVAPLNAALNAIANMKDPGQAGGKRKNRKNRKGTRKDRKNRKASTRKDRKNRKNTRKMRGGAWSIGNEQSVSASGMLLSPSMEAKALSGMNAEWKLAENPNSFAPGYKSY